MVTGFPVTDRGSRLTAALGDPASLLDWHPELPWDPWIKRIGKVLDIWATPCSPSPEVWVQGLFHEIPHLLYSFGAKPFMIADAFNRFGMHHHHKHKFRMSQMSGLLEGTYAFPEGAGWSLIKLGGDLGLKLLWWAFIADVTTEGLLEWVSLAYEYEGCQYGENYLNATISDAPILGFGAGNEFLVGLWTVTSAKKYSGGGFFFGADAKDDPSVGFSISTTPIHSGGNDATSSFYIYDVANDVRLSSPTEGVLRPDGTTQHTGVFRPFGYTRQGKTYAVLCKKTEGFTWIESGSFTMYGHKSPHHGIIGDP